MLDEYRLSFGEVYDSVVKIIREQLKLEPTGRLAKSTVSIVEKLRRESIRLSQVQDIAGCRVVVEDIAEQERVVASLRSVFTRFSVMDRRANPSYGYRAIHIIAQSSGKLVEIQVRTYLQHLWAELSEGISDQFDPAIKYGGGDAELQKTLMLVSNRVVNYEELESEISLLQAEKGYEEELQKLREQMFVYKKELVEGFVTMISKLEAARGQKSDLFN
ncbi:MAG: hypothetical protein ACREQV_24005 [Candidatus Binatia bacterium]